MISFLFAGLWLACVAVQIGFGVFFLGRLWRHTEQGQAITHHPALTNIGVSVVICAKNEAANLQHKLPAVLAQQYAGSYEVVVVDDQSTDHTPQILTALATHYPHLHHYRTPHQHAQLAGKKQALAYGIAQARYPYLLLTDADCLPSSCHWLTIMVQNLVSKPVTDIVLGVSPYLPLRQYPLLNTLIQYETAHTALQYLSFALAGKPYMGVGRNLAYKKSVYNAVGGFHQWAKWVSGDDDLLVGTIANQHNTTIVLHPAAQCSTPPPANWRQWFYQKKRHLSVGRHYQAAHLRRLGLLNVAHSITHLLALLWGIYSSMWLVAGVSTTLWQLYRSRVLQQATVRRLGWSMSYPQALLGDLLLPVYYCFFTSVLFFSTNTKWK